MSIGRTVLLLAVSITLGALLFGVPAPGPLSHGTSETASRIAPLGAAPLAVTAVQLFFDDFESGTSAWNLDANWTVVNDSGNLVLEGNNHAWGLVDGGQNWSDYMFSVDVKMLAGAAQLMFRMTDDRGRYILGLHPGGMYLRRESPWGEISDDLITESTPFSYGTWYGISIDATLNRIRISVGGVQRIDYTHNYTVTSWPLWQGSIGLEAVGTGPPQVRFDDVEVIGTPVPELSWVKTGGPIGGLGYDVRYSPPGTQTMYVSDNYSGINKSADGGQTWYATNWGISGRFWPSGDAIPVFTVTVDSNDPNNLWAGLKDVKGAYKSTNAGQAWTEVTPNIPENQFVFRGFTVMPGDPNVVFAAGETPSGLTGYVFGLSGGRVYKTEDAGANWSVFWNDESLARYVIVHPNDPNTIYISTGIFDVEALNSNCGQPLPLTTGQRGGLGVAKTTTGGASWTYLNDANGLTDLYVGSLVMHPNDPNVLLAGAGNNACSRDPNDTFTGGVFITRNSGVNWVQTLTNNIITAVEFAPSDPNIAYAGGRRHFFASDDGGHTWDLVNGNGHPWGPPGLVAGFPIDILVDPNDPETLFANNYGGGNVKSTDGGLSWTLASQGYTGGLMFDVTVDPDSGATVYATARSGVFRSLDGGGSWEGMAYPPALLPETYSIALKPDQTDIALVSQELERTMYRSPDGGFTWTDVLQLQKDPNDSNPAHGFKRIVFSSPPHTNVVYAGSCRRRGALHAGRTDSFGVFKSTDAGANWIEANDAKTEDDCINNLAIHPTDPNTAYAATAADGLFKTTDGGTSWTRLTALTALGLSDIRSVAIKPSDPNVVYVGVEGVDSPQPGGVYRSLNAGTSWTPMIAGMEANDSIWALVVEPLDHDVIWAGSFHSGVYRWDPVENLWTHVNDGLRTRAVVDLAITGNGSALYAATWGEGVFRLGDVPPPDNCPFVPNPEQFDADVDGNGDACQCGDVFEDGLLTQADVDHFRTHLANPFDPVENPTGLEIHVGKCTVKAAAGSPLCNIADVAVMRRQIEAPGLGPGIRQVCLAAQAP